MSITGWRWCKSRPRWCRDLTDQLQDPTHFQSGEHRQHCRYVLLGQVNIYLNLCVNPLAAACQNISFFCSLSLLITLQVSVTCHTSSSSSSPPPRRAAEKLSLTLRKKGQASDSAPAHLSTRFRDIIQKNPPSVPSCLLQAATRTRDSPNVGKVDSEASNSIRCTGEVCGKWPTFFFAYSIT